MAERMSDDSTNSTNSGTTNSSAAAVLSSSSSRWIIPPSSARPQRTTSRATADEDGDYRLPSMRSSNYPRDTPQSSLSQQQKQMAPPLPPTPANSRCSMTKAEIAFDPNEAVPSKSTGTLPGMVSTRVSFGSPGTAATVAGEVTGYGIFGSRKSKRSNLEDDNPNVDGVPIGTLLGPSSPSAGGGRHHPGVSVASAENSYYSEYNTPTGRNNQLPMRMAHPSTGAIVAPTLTSGNVSSSNHGSGAGGNNFQNYNNNPNHHPQQPQHHARHAISSHSDQMIAGRNSSPTTISSAPNRLQQHANTTPTRMTNAPATKTYPTTPVSATNSHNNLFLHTPSPVTGAVAGSSTFSGTASATTMKATHGTHNPYTIPASTTTIPAYSTKAPPASYIHMEPNEEPNVQIAIQKSKATAAEVMTSSRSITRGNSSKSTSPMRSPTAKSDFVVLMSAQELEDARNLARELRSLVQNNAELAFMQNFLELCKTTQGTVKKALEDAMKYDPSTVDLEELFTVNDTLLDAILSASKEVEAKREPLSSTTAAAASMPESVSSPTSSASSTSLQPRGMAPSQSMMMMRQSSSVSSSGMGRRQSTRSLEIDALVRKKDIFSLICMLRAQSDNRLESALALMRFARDAERKRDPESLRLRNEIRSSGGMHSLLTLFRTKGITREIKVVAALAVAYLLPSFVESSALSGPSLALKIVECLRFLFSSKPVSPKNEEITIHEMYNASAMGLATFWMNAFFPMLQQADTGIVENLEVRRARGRQAGAFDQKQETLEVQELLEIIVSLIVKMAKLTDSDMQDGPPGESKLALRYTLVEQMCAVDVARPLAVREGLLKVLVGWMKSKDRDKVRPAATSLRDLTSTLDKYMAGWIHSQIVNEGALGEIVVLVVSSSYGHDVRLAVAQILSSLCIAPHTRAAVVEAQCIGYLIPLLWCEQSDPASQQVAYAAGSALLQLAAGAMTRASVYDADGGDLDDAVSPDKRDKVISDIVNGGAIGPLVQMAISGERGKLRSMSIEALRVISEDTSPARLTRLQLCEDRAAEALGNVLKDDMCVVGRYLSNGQELMVENLNKVPIAVVHELHQALCTLANMLDPTEAFPGPISEYHSSRLEDSKNILIQGCIQITKSGGLQSLLMLASLSFTIESLSAAPEDVDSMDLLIEACRSLAALSPLLLSDVAAAAGHTAWTCEVLQAFTVILKRLSMGDEKEKEISEVAYELKNDALRGLSALATSEPLKIRIVDRSLPYLIQAKGASRGDRTEVANTAAQVCLSLGFAEDELAVQVAGNDPNLLGDWFCLQRSLLIQAMAREEIRMLLAQIWREPVAHAKKQGTLQPKLLREISNHSSSSSIDRDNTDIVSEAGIDEFFENIGRDEDSSRLRASVLNQYENLFKNGGVVYSDPSFPMYYAREDVDGDESGLLCRQVYPLNNTKEEKDWILGHQRAVKRWAMLGQKKLRYSQMKRVQKLLDSCIPSRLLQTEILPLFDLRPEASFNFRALVMPQRRYFSFRREGQLVQRLCDKQAAELESEDVHWTLGFTNSGFAGEFSETLVQAMYRCPMIRGLSFSRNTEWTLARSTGKESETDEGSGHLANLAGSLPPWVADLTYDNVLNDRAVKALVAILETMGRLSAGNQKTEINRMSFAGSQADYVGQKQGSFRLLAIRNSPHLDTEVMFSFFDLLGRSKILGSSPAPRPLASLRCLDLSGNDLGDETCSIILEIVHSKESRCCLEHLDLSRNAIRQGSAVAKVFRTYIELHRYNQSAGVKLTKRSWRSPLHSLNLSSNQLFAGGLPLELISLMKNNALSLKTLDLSYNDLEFEDYQFTEMMWGTLAKNTSLRELNLSGNNFHRQTIDSLVDRLKNSESESSLAFLRFDANSPPLTESQQAGLDVFEGRSRIAAMDRFLTDKERIKNVDNLFDSEMVERNPSLNAPNWSEDDVVSLFSEDGISLAESSLFSRYESQLKPPAKGDNMITVLFSAPLVFHDDQRKLRPFAKLDFDMERELLWQCLKEASRDITLSFDNATHHRLIATMTKRCSCLHYSGHGHPTYLPLEDGQGGPHWLEVNVLKDLIVQGGGAPFKFVFVSACHSGLAGETFASAGVPHVVCCQQESELKDTAALAFTRQFYLSLAVGHTVKESFEQGCKAVRATPNLRNAEREMQKFVLLPKDGNHDVPVFNARPVREWPKPGSSRMLKPSKSSRSKGLVRSKSLYFGGARSSELSVRNMMQEDPSPTPPQSFLGREVDMFHVLGAILTKRLVSVIGEPGIGRSSLVCAICHYINERASTILGIEQIFHVKTKQGRGGDRCRVLIQSLFNKLGDTRGTLHPVGISPIGMEELSDQVCSTLKNAKALIVFDRTELLENNDEAQDFPMFLSNLFRETRNVRVLLTGRKPLGIPSIGGVVEHHYNLGGLNFANSVRLFANLCPHLHTPAERYQFFQRMIIDSHQADLVASDPNATERTRKLFKILGNGMPAKAEKAAYSISADDVTNLGKD